MKLQERIIQLEAQTKLNRSRLMKRANSLYKKRKAFDYTFSEILKECWADMKQYIEQKRAELLNAYSELSQKYMPRYSEQLAQQYLGTFILSCNNTNLD